MKNILKNLKLLPFLFIGLASIFIISCEDETTFSDLVPDYTHSIIRYFEVNGEAAAIDHTTGTITHSLPAGADITSVMVDIMLPDGATVDPATGSSVDFSGGPVIFTVSNKGVSREYTATIAAYGDPMITTFSIGENNGVIDQVNGTIAVIVGSQEDIKALTPQYTIPGGTTSTPASGVSQDFSEPVKFTVTSNDGYTGKSYFVTVSQIAPPLILNFGTGTGVCDVTGIIDDGAGTIKLIFPAGANLSDITPIIEVTEGSSVSPESGVAQDFSGGSIDYVVTNAEGLTKSYAVSATTVASTNEITFVGEADCINTLIDDDAKAAALFLQQTYPDDFNYIKFSDITAASIASSKVIMLYYFNPLEGGFSANATNVMTMLPPELQPGTDQSNALTDWVKAGGDMFIAGDPTPFIHVLGRMPADYSQPRGPGNYTYTEFGCVDAAGACVDYGKPSDDIWGLGVRDANNSGNRRDHPVFADLTFVGDGELYLSNSATREARLLWHQQMDGILTPGCCGQDAALLFEQTVHAVKLGTLRWIGDAFGYGAFELLGTNGTLDPNFDSTIATDFKGHIVSLENTLIGYEFGPNDTVNDYQDNIEKLTTNIIDYLRALNND